jgi:hypothetical protein
MGRLKMREELNITRKLGKAKAGFKWIRIATNGDLF